MKVKASDNIAIVWKEDSISYESLLRHVNYFSTLMNKETDKVAIFSQNLPQWVYAFLSGWKNNSVVVPIDFMATAEEVAYILNDCRPEVIFCSEDTKNSLDEALKNVSYNPAVHQLDSQKYSPENFEPTSIEPKNMDETAVIIYTSGTTGSPKGVMLSFDNLEANIEAVCKEIPIFTPERNVLVLLPLHHIFPLMGTLIAPLSVGARIAFSPSMISEDIMATLQKNEIAIIIGVPRLYEAIRKGIVTKINSNFAAKNLFKLAKTVNSRSFSKKIFKQVHEKFGGKVEYMVCGGAKLNEEVAKDFKALGFEMLEGFGMTEAAPMITFTRPGKWKIGSAGQPVPGIEVKSVEGEIAAKGRVVMKGYYKRPEETAQVIKDGWLFTGDIGYLDKENYIHITGRSKEIIVLSNGKNINPEEIENKLKGKSDYIAEVGVYMKDELLTAAIYPDFKKLQDKTVLNYEEMFRWEVIDKYNQQASSYKKISKFILCKEELPKTRLGKIQRFKLAELVEGEKDKKEIKEPQFEEYQVIKEFLMDQKKKNISPDDHFEIDLGLDSLDKVNLHVFLESTFGIKIQDDILLHHPTVEKLSHYMKEKKNKLSVETVKWAEIFKEKVDLTLPKSWFTQNLFKNTSRYFFKVYFKLKGEGTENIPEGPFILAPNHQSFFDGLFVSVFLKNKVMKNTYFYAKEKHVRNKLVRTIANKNNVIVMDINRDLKESLQKLAEVLRRGKNIMIFPEGTRSVDGKLGEFKKAFAILSSELNVPIVPVSIKGANLALPKGSKIPRPLKEIRVKFLKPVYPKEHSYDSLVDLVYKNLAQEVQ